MYLFIDKSSNNLFFRSVPNCIYIFILYFFYFSVVFPTVYILFKIAVKIGYLAYL